MSAAAHTPSFSHHPLAILATAFAGGSALAHFSSAALGPLVPFVIGLLASLFASIAWIKGRERAATVALIFAFACAGATFMAVERLPPGKARLRSLYEGDRITSGDPVEVTGVIERAPEAAPDGLHLILSAERIRHASSEELCAGRVELFAPVRDARTREAYDALELRRGARVRVAARLTRAEQYRNPGVTTRAEYLERRGADLIGTIKSPLLVERLEDERVLLPLYYLDESRRRLITLTGELFAPDTAGVLKAALFGDSHSLTREAAERFRDGGTFHLLVVSGMHVTLVGGLVWACARLLTRRRLWQWLASAAMVWGFALAVGAESSVVRAALMLTAVTLAPAFGRRSSALNALGGAALVLLVWRPVNLLDPSFQLTFLSVLAIVALAAPLLARLREIGEWRPTRATPYPPLCPDWFRTLGEMLYWREREWRRELALASHSYRLFKTPWAARLGRLRVQAFLRYAFAAALVSLLVQVVLLPLLVVYFHRLPLAAPLLNVWAGLLLAAGCVSALAALLLSSLGAGSLTALFVQAAEAATHLAARGVEPFADADVASLRLPEYAGAARAVYALYFAPLLVLTFAILSWQPLAEPPRVEEKALKGRREKTGEGRGTGEGRERRIILSAVCALALLASVIVLHPLSAGRPDGRLRVDFLDVGQGDAALVTMPDGTTLLVDGGGRATFGGGAGAADGEHEDTAAFEPDSWSIGDRVVSEFLWHKGLSRVNFLLATHTDADHIEGLRDVLANFRVDAALIARTPPHDAGFARFAAAATKADVPVYAVARGNSLIFGAATVEVLWPPAADPHAPSSNDDSAVLRIRFGRRTVLLMGDIEAGAESTLVAGGDSLACDVLKVAHHGSRTSSTEAFVSQARPSLAVIPVGLDSPYGHPHREALARLRATGARILTTGEAGAITVSTDGEDLKVETFVRP
jgi:competence protein ComEC